LIESSINENQNQNQQVKTIKANESKFARDHSALQCTGFVQSNKQGKSEKLARENLKIKGNIFLTSSRVFSNARLCLA
jgi:hypothetical protein